MAETYARAWFELAHQHGQLDEAADEARQLSELFASSDDLGRLMANPAIDTGERASLIDRLFRDRLSELTLKFLHVVNRKGRAKRLAAILRALIAEVDKHHGVVPATATVADELPQDRLDAVAADLGRSLGDKTVRLEQRVDPSVIGGMRIRIGDRLLDASVATQLKGIENRLKAQGRERARQAVA